MTTHLTEAQRELRDRIIARGFAQDIEDGLPPGSSLERVRRQVDQIAEELGRLEGTCELTWRDANGKYEQCREPADIALSIDDGAESLSLCPKHVLTYPNP